METSKPSPSDRKTPILVVEPHRIFNMPIYEGHLILDARSKSDFDTEHITSAIPCPLLPSSLTDAEKDQAITFYLKAILDRDGMPSFINPLVLYGDESAEVSKHIEWVCNRFAILSDNPLPIPSDEEYLGFFHESLCNLKEIWIVKGGYQAFKEQFPIHCGLKSLGSEVPLPIYIAPGLYLGSRPTGSFERRLEKRLAYERSVLSELGISSVIINSDANLELEDAHGLKCFLINAADTNDINMNSFWDSAIDFIREMNSNHESVLIQFHGRSRSASVAIAWAMKVLRLPFQSAVDYVLSQCFYTLDKTLMYIDQLHSFENGLNRLGWQK